MRFRETGHARLLLEKRLNGSAAEKELHREGLKHAEGSRWPKTQRQQGPRSVIESDVPEASDFSA
jgi:hypothetical protein